MRPTLQIFAKAPIAGTVKTRLQAAIGEARAAHVHCELVERTLGVAIATRAAGIVDDIELWCAPGIDHPAFAGWRKRFDLALASQRGADLGARMHHALGTSLARGRPALLIGTDCPVLDVDYVASAAAALEQYCAVFGPAQDGGYVLVGLSLDVDAFSGIEWGSAAVMQATRAALRSQNVTWHELPVLWDVDKPDDLERWRQLQCGAFASVDTV